MTAPWAVEKAKKIAFGWYEQREPNSLVDRIAEALEAANARGLEGAEAMKHKECELCPFLGNGDPMVDFEAARKIRAEERERAAKRAWDIVFAVADECAADNVSAAIRGGEE